MRLYYYTAKQWGMKALWEERLKISTYKQLNDPFELLPFALTDDEIHSVSMQIKERFSQSSGIVCLSSDWKSTLMWSHYGDKHQGMCLGFDVHDDNPTLAKVQYTNKRLPCPPDFKADHSQVSNETYNKLFVYKHAGWEYEKEHRLYVRLPAPVDGIHYKPFGFDMQLREVILGPSCTMTPNDIKEAIEDKPAYSVQVFKARPSRTSFDVCRDESVPVLEVPGLTEDERLKNTLIKALREPSAR